MNRATPSSIAKGSKLILKELGHYIFFFFRSLSNRRSLGFLDCFTGQSPGIRQNELAISISLRGRWPGPSQSSSTRGWEAAGLKGWVWGLIQELAPERIIPFSIGKMGAVLVEEAGGKGLQGSMGQQGRPSVDEGSVRIILAQGAMLIFSVSFPTTIVRRPMHL